MSLINVYTKAHKHLGVAYPAKPTSYHVFLGNPKGNGYQGITIHNMVDGVLVEGSSFVVGDIAEYDSYNLSYTGTITKITDKSVTIVARATSSQPRTYRLDLDKFCWRNVRFTVAKAAAHNAEEMMCI